MSTDIISREHEVLFQNYRRLPIELDYGKGSYLYDTSGKKYLDFLSGIAVNALGHSHPKLVDAVVKQAQKSMHVSNFFYQESQVRLAELICELGAYQRLFFINSGAESFEGAIKIARLWGSKHNKTDIYAFHGGFHGRTYGSLSLMDKAIYRDGMGPFLPNMHVLPFNDIDALHSAINEHTCAVALEFLQGEGGIIHAEPEFINALESLKEQYNFLIIADEVQAGAGRTGSFFYFDKYLIKPDIVVMAKGMGGGLPLGAIVTTDELSKVIEKGMHGTTYGGNALACVAGIVVMEELKNGVQHNAKEMGCYLKDALHEVQKEFSDHIIEIRGCGCMQGIVLKYEASALVTELLKQNIITNATAINVLRLLPPLTISKEEIDEFINGLKISLQSLKQ